MAILKFEDNVPVVLAFTYDTGIEEDGNYGPQVKRRTTDGDLVYLPPIVEKQLLAMSYKRNRQVRICKSKTTAPNSKSRVTWSAEWPQQATERPLAGQPEPKINGAPAPAMSNASAANVMQFCLKTSIDLALWAVQYAKAKEMLLVPEFAAIKEMANTLFIQHSKGVNIATMHRNEEVRDTVLAENLRKRTPPTPPPAVAAASQRAVEQAPNDDEYAEGYNQPPIDLPYGVTDDDVPF